jgi:hypothetical protein
MRDGNAIFAFLSENPRFDNIAEAEEKIETVTLSFDH